MAISVALFACCKNLFGIDYTIITEKDAIRKADRLSIYHYYFSFSSRFLASCKATSASGETAGN